MGVRIQLKKSENTYLYICSQYVHTEQSLAHSTCRNAAAWKTSNSTTGPFCPQDQEPAARILKNICALGGYKFGSQITTF